MEDVTDPAFRALCKRYGADRVYTEFVNADALVRDIASTTRKLTIHDAERPVAIQIYGREPESMAEAARIVETAKPDFIDINFGCPVKKVAGKGAGAGLLKDVPKMLSIAKAVVNAVHTPVTCKTRLGWDENDLLPRVNPLDLPKSYSLSGLTAERSYSDNGLTGEAGLTAERSYSVSGLTAVVPPPRSMEEKVNVLKEHVLSSITWCSDERKGIVHSRRHFAASPVFKGLPDFRQTRIALLRAETKDEVFSIMDSIVARWGNVQ